MRDRFGPPIDLPSLFRLDGRTAVVTGAGSGLGREIARMLASAGASVVCLDRDDSSATETAGEIHGTAVRVNALAPSTFRTPLVERNMPARPDVYDRLLDLTPAGRFGDPSEIAGPARFLASDASSMVTGHVLSVDGGYVAQ